MYCRSHGLLGCEQTRPDQLISIANMATTPHSSLPKTADPSSDTSNGKLAPVCPLCKSPLSRIRRQPADRLFSVFVPQLRYQCSAAKGDPGCTWQGSIRLQSVADRLLLQRLRTRMYAVCYRTLSQLRATSLTLIDALASMDPPVTDSSPGISGDASFKDMAQITLDAIGDAVLVVDPLGTVIYLNKVAQALTGWPEEEALGRSVEEVFYIVDGITRERVKSPSQRAISENRIVALALGSVLIRHDGTDLAIEDSAAPIHDRRGVLTGAVIVFHDARLSGSAIQEMSHMAQHDSLTGLPNRLLLIERLTQAIGIAKRHDKLVALMFLDLDHFKQINDAFGHAVGDQLLRDVAMDMLGCVRATDTVSRHGGDEFVILLSEIETSMDAARVAEKLLARFAVPRVIDGHTIRISLSIGISICPDDGNEADSLMHKADQAMYAAKHAGRNRFQLAPGIDDAEPAVQASPADGPARKDA